MPTTRKKDWSRKVKKIGMEARIEELENQVAERDKRIETLKSIMRMSVTREEIKDLYITQLEAALDKLNDENLAKVFEDDEN